MSIVHVLLEICQQGVPHMTVSSRETSVAAETVLCASVNQSINHVFLEWSKIHWRWGIIYRGSMIMSGNEASNRNVFKR